MHARYGSAYPFSHAGDCTAYVPVVFVPVAMQCCDGGYPMKVPHSVEADSATSSQAVIVGGKSEVSLSLEYLIEDGAASPAVKVTASFEGATSTWSDVDTAPGYHVKDALMSAKPGTKVTIDVTEAMARLRWCETICC
jgi:hypothetical protein